MPKIKILDAGYVSALKMYAPIVNPVIVSSSAIPGILRENHKVIEYNDKGKAVLLTAKNYNDPNRFDEPKKEEAPAANVAETPVVNPYGNNVAIDTEAPVFTGYTKNTVMEFDPPKAAAAAETVAESGTKLTKAQKKALAKAKREEEAAKAAAAAEVSTETTVEDVVTVQKTDAGEDTTEISE